MSIVRYNPLHELIATQSMLSGIRGELSRVTEIATSGIAITRPSDAAGKWGRISALRSAIQSQAAWGENASSAASLLDAADTAMGGASDVMKRAHELAVQFGTDVLTDADRAAAVAEVDQLREQMVKLANTDFAGRYVFAGMAYDAPAYDTAGTYVGDGSQPSTQIGQNAFAPTGYAGAAFFDDALQALADLSAALGSGPGSADAVVATIDDLEAASDTVVQAWQQVGRDRAAITDAQVVAEQLVVTLQGSLTALVGADPTESLTELAELQTAYETALQVTASRLASRNLFAFLE